MYCSFVIYLLTRTIVHIHFLLTPNQNKEYINVNIHIHAILNVDIIIIIIGLKSVSASEDVIGDLRCDTIDLL